MHVDIAVSPACSNCSNIISDMISNPLGVINYVSSLVGVSVFRILTNSFLGIIQRIVLKQQNPRDVAPLKGLCRGF